MGLSPEDKGVAMEAFKLYEDEPGKILASNLGEVMRAPGANPTEEEIEGFTEGQTHIGLDEYLSLMDRQKMHENPASVLEASFTIFDAEGTGLVDTTELRSVIGNLGERFSSEEIGQMMLMSEINSEGKMSITDLIAFCSKYK